MNLYINGFPVDTEISGHCSKEAVNMGRLKRLCHETAHARQLRVNLKRLAQLFQVSRDDLHTEFIALNLGHPRIFFAFGGFVI